MKKSGFTSFLGWVSLFCGVLGWGDAVIGGFTIPHHPPFGAAAAAGFVLLSFACFVLWGIGTILHRARVNGARIQAAAMVEAQQRAAAQSAPARPAGSAPDFTLRRTGT